MDYGTKPRPCISLLIAGLFLLGTPAWADEEATEAKASSATYSGSLRGTYDYRALGAYNDHDSYAYWYFRGRNLSDKRLDVYTSGRFHYDLDGTGDSYSDDPFVSLEDTSLKDSVRVLQLFVDVHDQQNNVTLRGGRQYVDIADYIQMDGLQAMLYESGRFGGRVFFGLPVSYYSSVSRDLFGGASLIGRPWSGNSTRATFARYEDDSVSAADNHYFFDMKQQLGEEVRARGYLSLMNGDVRMGGADMFYMSVSEKVFDAALGIRRWGDYEANTRVYSPLYDVLGEQEPYTVAYGRFTTQVLPLFYLSPGAMLRRPDESNASNYGYERYDLDFIFEPSKALNASVALEYWNVEDNDSFFGLSGNIRYRHRNRWEASLGAAYVDYTYGRYTDFSLVDGGGSIVVGADGTRIEVSPYAFTYFLRGRWNVTDHLALRISGEIEDDSDETDLGYRIRTSLEVRL
jgi:hypothetical protein